MWPIVSTDEYIKKQRWWWQCKKHTDFKSNSLGFYLEWKAESRMFIVDLSKQIISLDVERQKQTA